MIVRSDIQQQAGEAARAKAAAKECLIAADKFLKDKQFDKARQQVENAREIDPANPYISAFEERIKTFEEQIRAQKEASASPAVQASPQVSAPGPAQTASPKITPPPPSGAVTPEAPKPTAPASPKPANTPPPKPAPAQENKPAVSPPSPKPAPAPVPKPEIPVPSKPAPAPPASSPGPEGDELKSKMDEMSRQILELSHALVSERKTREDVQKRQLEQSVKQLKDSMQKVWAVGAPKEEKVQELQDYGRSLGLDEDMIHSVTREVKLEMYGRAVKEMLAKRKLVRSSSSTMDWLRKVYQISMSEYLEYESRFLMDLVTDQFRGTLLLVAGNDAIRREVATKMKASGFAVVLATAPEEALEKIERVSPTIIITETQFPGRAVSGVMFLQLLRANPKFSYVPVLLLTDEQEAVTLASSELREIEGIARTPVDFDDLNAIINEKLALLRRHLSNL